MHLITYSYREFISFMVVVVAPKNHSAFHIAVCTQLKRFIENLKKINCRAQNLETIINSRPNSQQFNS